MTTEWLPASEPPQIPAGESIPVIVARKSDKGKWYIFGAVYLNEFNACDEGDEDDGPWTGFAVNFKHDYYDTFYEAIDVLFWASMPEPPAEDHA